jgi:hypothetical protein
MAQVDVILGQCRQEMSLNVVARRSSGIKIGRDVEGLLQEAVSVCESGRLALPLSTIRKQSGSGPEKCSDFRHPHLVAKDPRREH